MTAVHYTHYW